MRYAPGVIKKFNNGRADPRAGFRKVPTTSFYETVKMQKSISFQIGI